MHIKLCLQHNDLNNVQTLGSDNLLDLNASECKVKTFCRVNPQYVTYTLSEGSLDGITLVNDLGDLLDPRLWFPW